MALINCPECGKQISDKAENCIHCGLPLHSSSSQNLNSPVSVERKTLAKKKNRSFVFALIAIFLWAGTFTVLLLRSGALAHAPQNQQPQTQEQPTQSTPATTTDKPAENKLNVDIVSHKYYWYEDGDAAFISFSPDGQGDEGTATITSIVRVMEFRLEGDRNAIDVVTNPNLHAVFEYKYLIRDYHVHLTFVKSNVNYTGSNHILTYDTKNKTLSAYTNEGEMIFK
jgi:hypothetical protein